MNSATLTNSKAVEPATAPVTDARPRPADDSFRAWHFFVLISILLATVAVFLTQRSTPEHLVLISFTIAAAGVTAAAFYRMLLPLTAPEIALADEPLSDRHRATLERDKMLTLRAIKELEFDHAMGKLSQKDYDEMVGRLRQRALTLMRELDEGASYAPLIEQDLRKRLATAGVSPVVASAAVAACACGTANDVDALFCKKCGARLQA